MIRKTFAGIACIAVLAACGKREAESYRTDAVTRGNVTEVVSATGEVSAIVTVNVGSQVSGTISKLYVDFNSQVKKGQPLAEIDPRLFRAQLEKADAGLAAARAAENRAVVTLTQSKREESRMKVLFEQKLVSQQDIDLATTTRENNEAQLASARAQVLQAKADRDLAATNLAFTKITSPIDGIVVSRSIDIGQTVAAAFQAPTLFTIANDLTKMQILANIDEADVGKVHDGLDAKFSVDAYAGEEFRGRIREVRQAPSTIQNVVTYAAVIDAPNPERKLRQGMTAAVQITTGRRDNVLRVPNAALRWRPANAPPPGAPGGSDQRGERTLASAGRGGADGGTPPAAAAAAAGGDRPRRGEGDAPGPRRGEGDASGPRRGEGEASGPRRGEGDAPERGPRGRMGRVYKLENGKPVPVQVRLGLSDGQRSEVVDGLAENDQVIVGDSSTAGGQGGRPGGPGGGGRRGPF